MNAYFVTFYDAVNMIYDVIRIANLFSYTAKFMSELGMIKQRIRR